MLSRALSLATVTLLIGCLTAVAVRAVENLEAGKSPAQIFAGTCNACHKSPRGLLRSVPASSLSGFLRQHYTTSSDMANVLASYLVSNGATDTRVQKDAKEGKQGKEGKEGAKEGKQEARAPAEQPKEQPKQQARLPRPGETPDIMRPEQPAHAATDKGKKDKGKKGREEPARTEPAVEPPKETARETAKGDDSAKPEAEPKTESAKVEPARPAGEPAATRSDPVPAVTPAPSVTAAAPATSTPVPATSPPSGGYSSPPVQALDGPSAPAGEQPKPSVPVEIKAPAVAAAPALPPVPPAGPPTVPISQ
jgi:hypothetical protein